MLRFGATVTALSALGLVACSVVSEERSTTGTANATSGDGGVKNPLRCEGAPGIETLGLTSKETLVGIAGGRAYVRSATACTSRKLDGTDPSACPAPNAATIPRKLVAAEAGDLFFVGERAGKDVLYRTHVADGVSKVLHEAAHSDTLRVELAGDALLWTAAGAKVGEDAVTELWSVPKAGGDASKLLSLVDSGEQGILDGSIATFDAHGPEVLTAGKNGLRIAKTTDAFRSVGSPAIMERPDGEEAITDVALTKRSIALVANRTLWTIDRASEAAKRVVTVPEKVSLRGLRVEGESPVGHIDDVRVANKASYAFVRVTDDGKLEALLESNLPLREVTRDGSRVVWTIEQQGIARYFSVSQTAFGKTTIRCSDKALAAPATTQAKDAGAPGATADAGTGAAPGQPDDGGAGVAPRPSGDDDDVETSSDPTEPEPSEEAASQDGEHPTTVKINPACQSVPGTTGGPALGLGLALAAVALRRRRAR